MVTTEDARLTVTVDEAAEMLGIGRNLAYELAARGKLPGARRLGKRIIVSRKALDEFLRDPTRGDASS